MALSSERMTSIRKINRDKRPLTGGVKAIKGGRVACMADGYYGPVTGAAGEIVTNGIFHETVDNTAGADGAKSAEVLWLEERTLLLQKNGTSTLDVTDRERPCYAVDDETVDGDNTAPVAGTVYDVTTEGVWVDIG